MSKFKSFLLASTIIATLSPFSLSAISSEELSEKIRISRVAPVRMQPEAEIPAEKGWFSSFRQSAGNVVRWAGDQLRTEGDTNTAAGHLKETAKDIAAKYASTKVGIPLTSAIFNPIGNGLRKVGQLIKGGKETQTTTRVILNSSGLKYNAKQAEIERALSAAATALVRVDEGTAPEEFLKVVKGLNNRGFSTKQIDAFKIYVDAVASEVMQQNTAISKEVFEQEVMVRSFEMLQYITPVKMAPFVGEKDRLMKEYIHRAYKLETDKNLNNKNRKAALAAAAA
ncbi:MAG: hypothetical protein K2W92_10485 [Alphaproteobacteria bacterium]|nr:hypothetical protein [Alphaproteobacteria bacterium]